LKDVPVEDRATNEPHAFLHHPEQDVLSHLYRCEKIPIDGAPKANPGLYFRQGF
jgi:hypothetical protein